MIGALVRRRIKIGGVAIPFLFCSLLASCHGGLKLTDKNGSPQETSFFSKQHSSLKEQKKSTAQARNLNFRHSAQRSALATVKINSFFPEEDPLRAPDFYYEFFVNEFAGPYAVPTSDGHLNKTGTASGVLISSDGYVVTNYHVINTASRIDVVLSDRRSYVASVVGADKATDLALLKIKADHLPFLEFGNSDSIAVGDIVLIVGNPLNFTSTVTQGIISFKARNVAQSTERWTLQSYLQTDGVVNIGNSGGALVDLSGRLLGIVAAIASPNGVYAGYSFAIPVEVVKKTADDLLNYGEVRRGSLGIKVMEMDAEKAAILGTPVVAGILIDSIETGGAAEKAGLVRGDIITEIAGSPIQSKAQLSEVIARSHPGQRLFLKLARNDRQLQTILTLQDGSIY